MQVTVHRHDQSPTKRHLTLNALYEVHAMSVFEGVVYFRSLTTSIPPCFFRHLCSGWLKAAFLVIGYAMRFLELPWRLSWAPRSWHRVCRPIMQWLTMI